MDSGKTELRREDTTPSAPGDASKPAPPAGEKTVQKRRPPRLRQSCDSCHLAKVKCIKPRAETVCVRCSTSGLTCAHSLSARIGKPRGTINKAKQSETLESSLRATPVTVPSVRLNKRITRINDAYSQLAPTCSYLDAPFLQTWSNGVSNALWPEEHQFIPISPSIGSATPNGITSSHADWSKIMAAAVQPPFVPLHAPGPFSPTMSPTFLDSQILSPADEHGGLKLFTARSDDGIPCQCFNSNLQTLDTFHHYSRTLSTPSVITPFDVALQINKDAIARCTAMLRCPHCLRNCGPESSITPILVVAGIMDDTLASCRAACTVYFGNTPSQPTFSSTGVPSTASSAGTNTPSAVTMSPGRSSTSSMTSSSTLALSSSQLTLGNYLVDGEEARHLKLEILMIDVRKVERLSVQFRDVCAQLPMENEQKDLCAAFVFYFSKMLPQTMDMLEAHRKVLGDH